MSIIVLPGKEREFQVLQAFLESLALSGRSKHTLVNYRSDIIRFLSHLEGPLSEVTPAVLRQYFQGLSHLAPGTIARHQYSVSSLYSWGVRQEIFAGNPMAKVERIKLPESLPRPIEHRVVALILEAIPRHCLRDRLLFTLIRETGLRVSEALNIYIEDLALNADDEKIMIRNGKGKKSRTVMLYAAPETLKLLKKFLVQSRLTSGALFRGAESRGGSKHPMHYRSAHHLWMKYCGRAGVKASIHELRHTFATELLNEGVNVTVLKKLLGHKKLQTTMRYAEVTDQFVKDELMTKHRRK